MDYKFTSDKPIFLQIAEFIKQDIVAGKIKAGDRLKSVREFSAEFKANPNTVQKALAELETMGLIYTDSTNGKFVADDASLLELNKNKIVSSTVNKFFQDMMCFGLSEKEIIEIVNKRGSKWKKF